MSTYDQLHRQCRTLENLFDSKLTSYSQLVSTISRNEDLEASGSSARWKDLELELDDLLEKARTVEATCIVYLHHNIAGGNERTAVCIGQ
jgi:Golgi SNAP receptor complex protein 1